MSYYDELTPIHQACREGNTEELQKLYDIDPSKFLDIIHTPAAHTPLWWACKVGHAKVVQLLIEKHGVALDVTGSGTSPLLEAASNGHVAVVRELVARGAEVDKKDGQFASALSVASDRGQLEMVKVLVECGADVNDDNSTPILFACAKGHLDVIKFLAQNGSMVHGGYLLAGAVYHKQTKVVDWLLTQAGVKVDALVDGRTALTLAVRDNMEDMARMLLRNGASPHVKLPRGEPMLFHAISSSYYGVARVLLQHGPKIDEVFGNENAMLVAVKRGNLETVQMLWQAGANLNVTNVQSSLLCAAIQRGHWDIAGYLVERGANPKMRENNILLDTASYTPLHLLCLKPEHSPTLALAALLLRNGADVNAIHVRKSEGSESGMPPIYYAVQEGYIDMVWKLVFAGANLEDEVFVDGFPQTSWEACLAHADSEMRKALFHFWEPNTHFRHPKRVREAIVCLLLISKRQKWGFDEPVLHHLFSFIAYKWPEDSRKRRR